MKPLLAAALIAPALALAPAAQPPAAPPAAPAVVLPPAPTELISPADLVSYQRGNIPIILSAPHGGGVRISGSKDRSGPGVVLVRDMQTAEMAWLVSQRLTEKCAAKPYVVIAQFSRKDADPNRAPAEGAENDAARAQYDAYHRAVQAAVDECRARFGSAILIDLHGQVKKPDSIVRGTRNGQTVTNLIKKHGNDALIGAHSIFGQLKAKGYPIWPDEVGGEVEPAEPLGKETLFDGGYIVAHYGSQNANGIDAIQVEVGGQRSNALVKFSRDLGDSIADFYDNYLKVH